MTPARRIRAGIGRVTSFFGDPGSVLPMLLIGAFGLRAIWLDMPRGSLIFDEAYYVNAARTLLGWSVADGAPYFGAVVGLDPNAEHPPLGKLLMALSMQVLGDNGIGWRLPSLIAGMIAIAAVYLIVRSTRESSWLGVLAVGFFGFDNLAIVHSRIGTLDILALAPILVGAWLGLRGRWGWAGALVGLGILIKLTAVYALLALLVMLLLEAFERSGSFRRIGRSDLRRGVALIGACLVVSVVGLWVLDARFTDFASPVDHVLHMIQYGASLHGPVDRTGMCTAIDSPPWEWPFNDCQINYLRVDTTVSVGNTVIRTTPSIDFRGALNPVLAGAIPLAFLFAIWAAWRMDNRLARWSVVWAAANFLPFVVLALVSDRVMYLYYFLPVVPAVAVAVAVLLLRAGLPRFVAWGFIGAFALGVLAYFPFRQIP